MKPITGCANVAYVHENRICKALQYHKTNKICEKLTPQSAPSPRWVDWEVFAGNMSAEWGDFSSLVSTTEKVVDFYARLTKWTVFLPFTLVQAWRISQNWDQIQDLRDPNEVWYTNYGSASIIDKRQETEINFSLPYSDEEECVEEELPVQGEIKIVNDSEQPREKQNKQIVWANYLKKKYFVEKDNLDISKDDESSDESFRARPVASLIKKFESKTNLTQNAKEEEDEKIKPVRKRLIGYNVLPGRRKKTSEYQEEREIDLPNMNNSIPENMKAEQTDKRKHHNVKEKEEKEMKDLKELVLSQSALFNRSSEKLSRIEHDVEQVKKKEW